MTTSSQRKGVVVVPNVACALPKAFSPQDALSVYLKKKKEMPQLTPAAWRKAAAQEMGLDYDTYLALWKVHKGSAKALKMMPESTPTVPAASSSSQSMGFSQTSTASQAQAFDNAVDTIKGYKKQVDSGVLDADDIADALDDVVAGDSFTLLQKKQLEGMIDDIMDASKVKPTATTSVKVEAAKDVVDAVPTPYGPLTHDLAQDAYKQMKKAMPNATPAVWRKAAAEKLGVNYNDYLKAWKKPTSATQKAATKPVTGGPVGTPLKQTGKYADQDITPEQLKEELARAYGPEANKAYINFTYDDLTGTYTVQFPNSILPTGMSKLAVAEKLRALGLDVKQTKLGWFEIRSPQALKTAKSNQKQIDQTGTYTLPDGKVVLDMQKADQWTERWWSGLSHSTRAAWDRYTASGYRTINGNLRSGKAPTTSDQAISKSMQKVEHEFTVFRGTDIDIHQFTVGGKWRDKGFMSTSVNPGGAWNGVKFEIVLPKGSRGMYIGKRSSHPHENEFLIDKNTEFRVIEVDRINKRVKMVAIPH